MSDVVLAWFSSYLSGRKQTVQVGSEHSETTDLDCGFARGSVLGGPKYNMFATPIDEFEIDENSTDLHTLEFESKDHSVK